MDTAFDIQIQQGLDQRLVGWDFSWLAARTEEEALPWDYRQIVLEHLPEVHALLDVGTGGGEFLASLAPLPEITWATEGYAPNVLLAQQRLAPLGVRVADTSSQESVLPLDDNLFDLVIDRHEGLRWSEITRVLRPGGYFITQQVGGENCFAFNSCLQEQPGYLYGDWSLQEAVSQLTQAGMQVVRAQEAFPRWVFKDIAAVVFYLQAIPWQIADFSVTAYRKKLYALYQQIQREGSFTVFQHRLLLEARKPGA